MAVTHDRTVLRARASPRQRRSAGQGLATRPTTVSRLTVVAPINRVAITLDAVVTVRVRGGKIVPEFVSQHFSIPIELRCVSRCVTVHTAH